MAQKKLSRRDAIKLQGAAIGATALANMPAKWSKSEIITGVLPAHAQTSCTYVAGAQTFATPGSYDFIVPCEVTSLNVDAFGAQGGAISSGTTAALGGQTTHTIPVTPGETLTILVGGAGATRTVRDGVSGGINGGGFGGNGEGGGWSGVMRSASMLVVAGGGGGSTGHSNGGGGGGTTGAAGDGFGGGGGYFGGGGGGGSSYPPAASTLAQGVNSGDGQVDLWW